MCKNTTKFMSRIQESANTNHMLIWKQNIDLHFMNILILIYLYSK